MTGTKESIRNFVYGNSRRTPRNEDPQNIPYPEYDLLPGLPSTLQSRRSCCYFSANRLVLVSLLLVSLGAISYMLFPMEPTVQVTGVTIEKINIYFDESNSILPSVHLDVSMSLKLKITNPNFFGVVYDNVTVFIFYRGDKLGAMQSEGGKVASRSVSKATATLDLQSAELVDHATDLIKDMDNGEVPLQTITLFTGSVRMVFLTPSIRMRVACNMLIDPKEKEVVDKDCTLIF